jgi:hypothetical protein
MEERLRQVAERAWAFLASDFDLSEEFWQQERDEVLVELAAALDKA